MVPGRRTSLRSPSVLSRRPGAAVPARGEQGLLGARDRHHVYACASALRADASPCRRCTGPAAVPGAGAPGAIARTVAAGQPSPGELLLLELRRCISRPVPGAGGLRAGSRRDGRPGRRLARVLERAGNRALAPRDRPVGSAPRGRRSGHRPGDRAGTERAARGAAFAGAPGANGSSGRQTWLLAPAHPPPPPAVGAPPPPHPLPP